MSRTLRGATMIMISISRPCGTMCRRQLSKLFLGLFLVFSAAAAAEVVYVHDAVRLDVRDTPVDFGAPVAEVTTGAELTVLEREGDYIRIRTTEGVEGWISQSGVSSEQPARLQLEQLRKELERQEAQSAELRKTLADSNRAREAMESRINALTTENAALKRQNEQLSAAESTESESRESMSVQLSELQAENASLHQQMEQFAASAASAERGYAWIYLVAIMIVLLAGGFYAGTRWQKHRVSKRFGGMEI